jgi:hypothetical protein
MRRSVATAAGMGADARGVALAVAPAVLDVQADMADPVGRVAAVAAILGAEAVVASAAVGIAGSADRATLATVAAAGAGMTGGRPVTGKATGMSGGHARMVTVAPTVVLTVPPSEGGTTVAPTAGVDVRPMAVRREVPSAVGAAVDR